ncbi:MAG TPA: hypothetical protein PLH27_11590 [bacterium]|nr:hypothetical protein [bacterium]HMW33316.1 hypothetical protein [bacterium]HMW35602.1 hypothetical protein [bacterium]HMY36592.1 hypothetical protein [bacterium]HMZ03966.1 hypothetical protein [bacterium]
MKEYIRLSEREHEEISGMPAQNFFFRQMAMRLNRHREGCCHNRYS